jgi:hypothetical protein
MLEVASMVKVTNEAVPEEGILPEPDQPVQTYWTPAEPCARGVTDSFMLEPESNQPLDGEGES